MADERRLWFGILAAPAGWTVSELAGASVGGTFAVVLALLAAAVSAAGAATAYRVFRRRAGDAGLTETRAADRVEFMALAGLIISGFLLLNILFFVLLPLLVAP